MSPPPEPGLSSRVWLDAAMTQIGLAMARSIGDHAVKSIGVVAEPEVTTHTIEVQIRGCLSFRFRTGVVSLSRLALWSVLLYTRPMPR